MAEGLTGARFIAETLRAAGTSHVFFVDAILRRTLIELEEVGIRRVLAHSEKAAAYMADGYARASSRPGVCFAQSVGAANLAAGLQDAYLHRAPVIAMTGRKPPMFQHRNAYQEIDHDPLFAAVTKLRARVDVSQQLPLLLPQAFRAATEGTPRPVHLDLMGLQGEVIETGLVDAEPTIDKTHRQIPARRPAPDPREIIAATQVLMEAERPVLVIGAGAIQAGAQDAVRLLAEGHDIPIATSLGGRGIVPTDHPRHIGTVGTYSAPPTNKLVHEADLVIFVGCHTGDQPTNNWTVPGPGTKIIQIDIDGTEIGRNYPLTTGVLGDPGIALDAIGRDMGSHAGWKTWAEHARAVFQEWRASMAPLERSDARPIRTERLCHDLSSALPEDAILVADTGYSGIWTATMVELRHAGQSYLRAAGSLGWSYPAALGAKCACPSRPVVCFSGDGAIYYHLTELETARRHNLAVVLVINNNSAFGQGLVNVRKLYGNRPGNPDEIIRFGPTDFAAVARAFGVEGIRVEDPAEIAPALKRALAMSAPVVVDVATDAEPRAPEAWNP